MNQWLLAFAGICIFAGTCIGAVRLVDWLRNGRHQAQYQAGRDYATEMLLRGTRVELLEMELEAFALETGPFERGMQDVLHARIEALASVDDEPIIIR